MATCFFLGTEVGPTGANPATPCIPADVALGLAGAALLGDALAALPGDPGFLPESPTEAVPRAPWGAPAVVPGLAAAALADALPVAELAAEGCFSTAGKAAEEFECWPLAFLGLAGSM